MRAAACVPRLGMLLFSLVFSVGFVDLFVYGDNFQGRTDMVVPHIYRFFLGMCMAVRFYGHFSTPHEHGLLAVPLATLSFLGTYRLLRHCFRMRLYGTSETVSRFEKYTGSLLKVALLSIILYTPLYWLSNMAAALAYAAAMMTAGKYVHVGPAGFLVYSIGLSVVVLAMFVTPAMGVRELLHAIRRLVRGLRSRLGAAHREGERPPQITGSNDGGEL